MNSTFDGMMKAIGWHREQYSVPHRSIILWPDEVNTGKTPNESTDDHRSKGSALAVCHGIQREGLGGMGKVFPLSTRVEPIE